jgi:hypothetical protein
VWTNARVVPSGIEVVFGRIEHLGREGMTHRVRLSIPDACGLDALPPGFFDIPVDHMTAVPMSRSISAISIRPGNWWESRRIPGRTKFAGR